MRTVDDLRQLQALPLSLKIRMTQERVRQWVYEFGEDGVYIAFSGGKDSTVLLHIVRQLYPKVVAVFCDTGLEFPEIREFVKKFDNVDWLKPKKSFRNIIIENGYPFVSKEMSEVIGGGQRSLRILAAEGVDITCDEVVINECRKRMKKEPGEWRRLSQCYGAITKTNEIKMNVLDSEKGMFSDIPQKYRFILNAPFQLSGKCCNYMKKDITHDYTKRTGRHGITGQMADESRLRKQAWLRNGCNAFTAKNPVSNPMSFWHENDVLEYIRKYDIEICDLYGDIVEKDEVPGQITFMDMGFCNQSVELQTTGAKRTGCMFCGFGCQFEKPGEGRFERMKQTHPKQYEWIMKDWELGGLGYKSVIDWLNENGNLNIRY